MGRHGNAAWMCLNASVRFQEQEFFLSVQAPPVLQKPHDSTSTSPRSLKHGLSLWAPLPLAIYTSRSIFPRFLDTSILCKPINPRRFQELFHLCSKSIYHSIFSGWFVGIPLLDYHYYHYYCYYYHKTVLNFTKDACGKKQPYINHQSF